MKMRAWNVYLNNRLIDTVFYVPSCSAEEVLDGLTNHDGYNPAIRIIRATLT